MDGKFPVNMAADSLFAHSPHAVADRQPNHNMVNRLRLVPVDMWYLKKVVWLPTIQVFHDILFWL